mmetsp:Transcript_28967/g.68884  ORF Transcript_28967/g.68884 Transcript_28967/m.68884 type:complete len:612 (-) Transcript_28967:16-1851(-)
MEDASAPLAQGPKRNKLFGVCSFILVVEMCERLCYYTLQGSQRNFLEDAGPGGQGTRGMQASAAFSVSACWSMMSYLSCLLGGYLADNRLGRYRTILYFAGVYVLGVAIVALSAVPAIMATDASVPLYLFGAFVFVALGTGAIKPNVMNFGADQYDVQDAEERAQQKTFFSYFYLTINIGVVFAMGFTVNLATSGSTTASAGSGYVKAFCIAACAMFTALCCFALGTPRYVGKGRAQRRPMVSIIWKHLQMSGTTSAKLSVFAWALIPVYMATILAGSFLGSFPTTSKALTWLAFVMALASCGLLVLLHRRNDFIPELEAQDRAITSADVRGALDCVPTIICINVGFNIPYNAMSNAYPAQACQMDTRLFGQQLNGSFFSLGDAFGIILLVPVFEKLLFPAIRRCRGRYLSRSTKYVIGFSCGIAANFSAALLEYIRRSKSTGSSPDFVPCPEELLGSSSCDGGNLLSKCSPGASLPMTNMSAFWTAIPMFLTGAGEILVNPVVYQYVFEEAPAPLRSMLQALNLVAAGSISNAITAALSPLVPENLNDGHLVYFFYANCILAVLALLVFLRLPQNDREAESGVPGSFLATVDHSASVSLAPPEHAASLMS